MPLDVSVRNFSNNKLQPLFGVGNREPLVLPINIAPNLTVPRGRWLGQFAAAANAVQTMTAGSASGGTYQYAVEYPVGNVQLTTALAFNANAAAQAAALAALPNVGSGNVGVTGTGPFVITFQGALGNRPIPLITVVSALTGGTAHAVANTTTGRRKGDFGLYVDANVDGTGVAKCICPYALTTDAAGFISFADVSAGGVWGEKMLDVEAYFGGVFNCADLVGLDAAALADVSGHLIYGTVSDGAMEF